MNIEWWRGATLYQIYPRSFADASGDGVGDLAGIARHLPYVASLGVDGVWISPFFPSPMRDFGYDVADHCAVDPLFGSLADFDALLEQAHRLHLKVVIDQVWSHTAAEHPWFQESRSSRHNPKADWYVWADARPDGSPPTNWQSWMGGSTWTWEPRRGQYYLHNFLPQMPDLNLHQPDVQDALLEVGRFWLARGVDGFRLDTANYYCHDPQLRDNPPQPPERRGDVPAAMQQHLFNVCQPQTLPFLARVRSLLDEFGATGGQGPGSCLAERHPLRGSTDVPAGGSARFAVAEIGSHDNLGRMIEYTRGHDRLHTAYSFLLLGSQPRADALADMMRPWQEGEGATAWPSWALSNHDAPRVATRWARGDAARARQLLALQACLRGTVFLYQGEELGLLQSDIAFADLQDPFGKARWPRDKGRDGCRTPMPWVADHPAGGFTTGRPWLPSDAAHRALSVDRQEADPGSTLHFTRRVLALRRAHPALRLGAFQTLYADADLLVCLRLHEADTVLAAFNLGEHAATHDLGWAPQPGGDALAVNGPALDGARLVLPPGSALIVPLQHGPHPPCAAAHPAEP